jgi:hypothetical protein
VTVMRQTSWNFGLGLMSFSILIYVPREAASVSNEHLCAQSEVVGANFQAFLTLLLMGRASYGLASHGRLRLLADSRPVYPRPPPPGGGYATRMVAERVRFRGCGTQGHAARVWKGSVAVICTYTSLPVHVLEQATCGPPMEHMQYCAMETFTPAALPVPVVMMLVIWAVLEAVLAFTPAYSRALRVAPVNIMAALKARPRSTPARQTRRNMGTTRANSIRALPRRLRLTTPKPFRTNNSRNGGMDGMSERS